MWGLVQREAKSEMSQRISLQQDFVGIVRLELKRLMRTLLWGTESNPLEKLTCVPWTLRRQIFPPKVVVWSGVAACLRKAGACRGWDGAGKVHAYFLSQMWTPFGRKLVVDHLQRDLTRESLLECWGDPTANIRSERLGQGAIAARKKTLPPRNLRCEILSAESPKGLQGRASLWACSTYSTLMPNCSDNFALVL